MTRSLAGRGSGLDVPGHTRLTVVDKAAEQDAGAASSAIFLDARVRHHLAMACDAEEPARICDHIIRATAYLKLFNRLGESSV